MNRREFLSKAAGISVPAFMVRYAQLPIPLWGNENLLSGPDKESETCEVFYRIMEQARKEKWASLSVGENIGKIGKQMIGTEYAGGTLEGEGPEICRVDLTGLDCVTLYENVLCMARILKKRKTTFDDFVAELAFTRYRRGKLTDYTSRLHYTSDWIYDNEKKKVVRDITEEIGGEEFPIQVSFMSEHPHLYPALKEFPEFIEIITSLEEEINKRKHWFVPQGKIKKAQKHLKTGDIIAVATNKEGLDYAHTGLAYRDKRGIIRFLHASQEKGKVFLDTELSVYIQSVKTYIGMTVARPCPVLHFKNLQHDNSYDCGSYKVVGHRD